MQEGSEKLCSKQSFKVSLVCHINSSFEKTEHVFKEEKIPKHCELV
jgi:hypothetical protein